MAMFAGVGAVAVAGIAAFMLMSNGAPDASVSNPSSPAASIAPEVPVAAVAPKPAGAAAASVHHANAAAAKASAVHHPVAAAKPPAPAAAVEVSRAPILAAAPKREDVRPTSAPAGTTLVESCKDKIFLAREFCLAENCKKPGQRNHPLCVEWREDVKLREAGRSNNGSNAR